VQKKYRDKWYQENKERQMARQLLRRRELMAWFQDYKRTLKCEDCEIAFIDNPEWVDFHHLDPLEKDDVVGKCARSGKGKLLKEIEKCVPLCSNCHRTRHTK
jgi:predicted HNH restriction endonuclease